MNMHNATEQAYKNGYADGLAASKSKWISVEDRLPTEQDVDADCGIIAIHKRSIKKYFHWKNVADNPFDFICWMPLPEAPKGGEDE